MTIQNQSYFLEALEEAKIRQLIETYSKWGFVRDSALEKQGGISFDLVLRNPETKRVVVFEIKFYPLSEHTIQQIEMLKRKAGELGYEFRLVTIVKPARFDIQIDWLPDAMLKYFVNHSPSEITNKASQVTFEKVSIDIESIHVTDNVADASVLGSVDVLFESFPPGADYDDDKGVFTDTIFPFTGQIRLDLSSKEVVQAEIQVDDSEWMRQSH